MVDPATKTKSGATPITSYTHTQDAHTGTQRESVTWFSKQPDLIIMQTDKCLVLFKKKKKKGALTTWLCIEVINMHTFTNWHINLPSFQSVPRHYEVIMIIIDESVHLSTTKPLSFSLPPLPPVSGPSPNQFVSPSLPKEGETARHCCQFHTCHATQLR